MADLEEVPKDKPYFHGFGRSPAFERLFHRYHVLVKWKELVMRPEAFQAECDPDDIDLIDPSVDYPAFLNRCQQVRVLMNEHFPSVIETVPEWDDHLIAKTSLIPNSGMGLFYCPKDGGKVIAPGTTVCYYTGHLYDAESASQIADNSYLLQVLNGLSVDPTKLPFIKARYINDPKNQRIRNCMYVAQDYRAAIVTTKPVHPGQEFFVSYGDFYWSQCKFVGTSYDPPATVNEYGDVDSHE